MGYIIRLSFANLKQRKLRTALTIVGIMIGIMSIVTMLTIGIGAKKTLVEEVEQSGNTRMILVSPISTTRKDMLITSSVIGKMAKLDKVQTVYPVLRAEGQEKFGSYVGYSGIIGVPSEYLEVLGAAEGKLPRKNGSKPQLLAGKGVRNELYNEKSLTSYSESPEGDETLAGKRISFIPEAESATATDTGKSEGLENASEDDVTSIGLKITGETGNRYDWNLYTDIDTLKVFLKRQYPDGGIPGQPVDKDGNPYGVWAYYSALVFVNETSDVEHVSEVIKNMGFQVRNNLETLESVNRTIGMVQLVLGAIGIIAGIVALTGIINTMMTAVYDRIREIGLLKMLGADTEDISFMFLFEAGLLGGVGGSLGIGLSLLADLVINNKLVELMQLPEGSWIMGTPVWLIVLSFVISVAVSVIAGAYPAARAARIKPLDAITM